MDRYVKCFNFTASTFNRFPFCLLNRVFNHSTSLLIKPLIANQVLKHCLISLLIMSSRVSVEQSLNLCFC